MNEPGLKKKSFVQKGSDWSSSQCFFVELTRKIAFSVLPGERNSKQFMHFHELETTRRWIFYCLCSFWEQTVRWYGCHMEVFADVALHAELHAIHAVRPSRRQHASHTHDAPHRPATSTYAKRNSHPFDAESPGSPQAAFRQPADSALACWVGSCYTKKTEI